METPINPPADRPPAKLGNFASALLGKIKSAFTRGRPFYSGCDSRSISICWGIHERSVIDVRQKPSEDREIH